MNKLKIFGMWMAFHLWEAESQYKLVKETQSGFWNLFSSKIRIYRSVFVDGVIDE